MNQNDLIKTVCDSALVRFAGVTNITWILCIVQVKYFEINFESFHFVSISV